jgi:hypothetical protein
MLRIRLLIIGLFTLTWLAGAAAISFPTESPAGEPVGLDAWRQTSHGWQRCDVFLTPPIEYRHPAIHPLVVGSLQILLTVTAMLTFSVRPRQVVPTQGSAGAPPKPQTVG